MSLNVLVGVDLGALVFFMQAGFALVETGFTRNKNVAHTMMMNMMVFCIGAIGYWLTGFAFQFGGVNYTYPAINGNARLGFLAHHAGRTGRCQLDTPLLVGGSGCHGAERLHAGRPGRELWRIGVLHVPDGIHGHRRHHPHRLDGRTPELQRFVWMGLWVSMFIYPLVGNWVWGGGWLANLGRTMGWGNGAVDFAGSGVVHSIGGAIALAGAIVIGPRIGKFNKDGSANTIPGHSISLGVLGTIILFFGWFGFNPGSSLGFVGAFRNLAVLAAVNTLLAGAAGGVAAMCYMWLVSPLKKPDGGMSVNGILAGLVAITAPCAFVDVTGGGDHRHDRGCAGVRGIGLAGEGQDR